MVKLDLALVFQQGYDRPVPVEMDRQMIVYVVGERIEVIRRDPTLIDMVPYDDSDVFYKSRTHLNHHG